LLTFRRVGLRCIRQTLQGEHRNSGGMGRFEAGSPRRTSIKIIQYRQGLNKL